MKAQKVKETQEIKAREQTPMSDADLERYTGVKAQDVIKYSQLRDYGTMNDLLPLDKSFRIILIEIQQNNGHWVAIMRYGKTIEYFNSYGVQWDTDWKFVSRIMRIILGETSNEMTRLMKSAQDEGFHTIYNQKDFQKRSKSIQTCGRWCVFRIELMKMGYNLQDFIAFVEEQKKKLKRSYDFVVSKFIS
jgi:hypothetical protein